MSTDPAVQAAEDALYAIGAGESYTFAKLARVAVEAARPIIEAETVRTARPTIYAEALHEAADWFGSPSHNWSGVRVADSLRGMADDCARAAVRTEPEQ